ncbi:MAG: hypothetical protein Q8T08_13815 [Ignavibacteria bacterium]|jgi:hypothetical protein|nr:hypothetical protein [Ignavibacteria bacterium]
MPNVNPVKGVHDIRSLRVAKKSCIPGKQQTNFLELYMLDKEKERLSNEEKRIILRLETLNNRLNEIQQFFHEKLGQVQNHEPLENSQKASNKEKTDFKTMSIDY